MIGPDGAGKSTVIYGIEKHLKSKGLSMSRHHWKPMPQGGDEHPLASVEDPHGEKPRPQPISLLKTMLLVFVWRRWFFQNSRRHKAAESLIVFDRFYDDLYCDPLRYRYARVDVLSGWLLKLMPKPRLVIVLDAPVSVLLERKQELSKTALCVVVKKYRNYASSHENAVRLDTHMLLSEVVASACKLVEDCYSEDSSRSGF